MDTNKQVAEQIAMIVRKLPPLAVAILCEDLDKLDFDTDLDKISSTARHLHNADTRASFLTLISFIKSQQLRMDAHALSMALRSASAASSQDDRVGDIELVWSGPSTIMSTFRRTDQALSDIIAEAQRTLLVVSFAVVKVPHVMASLGEAIRRGVSVNLVIETERDSGGKLKSDGLAEIKNSMIGGTRLFVWPEYARQKSDNGRTGVLHAKCAVADSKTLLISSANLTEAAMYLNMELGIIVRGGPAPSTIAEHFSTLISAGTLIRIDP